jgi:hypothetical protein
MSEAVSTQRRRGAEAQRERVLLFLNTFFPSAPPRLCASALKLLQTYQFSVFFLLSFLLSGCSPQTPEEFRSEGRREQRKLIECLSHIQTEEQLILAKPELNQLFKEWGDLICAAHQFRRNHPEAAVLELSEEDYALNEQLKQEMRRLCRLRGGEEALAEAEKVSLSRLKRL